MNPTLASLANPNLINMMRSELSHGAMNNGMPIMSGISNMNTQPQIPQMQNFQNLNMQQMIQNMQNMQNMQNLQGMNGMTPVQNNIPNMQQIYSRII